MKQISEDYLNNEKGYVNDWAAYISSVGMTRKEAIEYISKTNTQPERQEAALCQNAVKKALNEIQINLENNYKDLAINAYNDAAALIETYRADKKLNDKEYEKYKQELAVFHKRMEGYSHRLNVKY